MTTLSTPASLISTIMTFAFGNCKIRIAASLPDPSDGCWFRLGDFTLNVRVN